MNTCALVKKSANFVGGENGEVQGSWGEEMVERSLFGW